jgi:SAM-dependent methyltransferase
MVAAYDAQQARLAPREDAWSGYASFFKADPRRKLDNTLERIASYLRPEDTLLDVGGGAGRMALPMALRCRDVVVIDPSPAMGEVFRETASEAGITNARFVEGDWLTTDGIEGDVTLVAHVTYFVPTIASFIQKLDGATRRRVVIDVRSVPPPNQVATLFQMARGEELARVPGHEQLLPVLQELGIDAELIDIGPAMLPATAPAGKTRDEAIGIELEGAVRGGWLRESERDDLRQALKQRFDELFVETPDGYRRRVALEARELLITWEPA